MGGSAVVYRSHDGLEYILLVMIEYETVVGSFLMKQLFGSAELSVVLVSFSLGRGDVGRAIGRRDAHVGQGHVVPRDRFLDEAMDGGRLGVSMVRWQ